MAINAEALSVRYAKRGAKTTWGTRTRQGDTCFSGLSSKREAERLALLWSKEFPEYGPYGVSKRCLAPPPLPQQSQRN